MVIVLSALTVVVAPVKFPETIFTLSRHVKDVFVNYPFIQIGRYEPQEDFCKYTQFKNIFQSGCLSLEGVKP